MEGAEPQLRSHFGVGMYNGITKNQLAELVTIIEKEVSPKRGMVSGQVLQAVINQNRILPLQCPMRPSFLLGKN